MPKNRIKSAIVACRDHQSRTCIQVERSNEFVKFIPLDVGLGLHVQESSASEFDRRYQPMVDYPAEKACQLYLSYSQNIGASKEALEYLGQVINVSKQEFEMATKKQQTASQSEEKQTTRRRKTNQAEKPEKPAKAGRRTTGSTKAEGGKKPTAARMFQDLIMEGKLTDSQIFEKVQGEFGLDEKKRGYVKWYRNHLRKQGKNPPEPKTTK